MKSLWLCQIILEKNNYNNYMANNYIFYSINNIKYPLIRNLYTEEVYQWYHRYDVENILSNKYNNYYKVADLKYDLNIL